MSFRLVPNSVTLNNLERRNGRYFACYFSEFAYLPGVLRKSSRSLSHLLMSSCWLLWLKWCLSAGTARRRDSRTTGWPRSSGWARSSRRCHWRFRQRYRHRQGRKGFKRYCKTFTFRNKCCRCLPVRKSVCLIWFNVTPSKTDNHAIAFTTKRIKHQTRVVVGKETLKNLYKPPTL